MNTVIENYLERLTDSLHGRCIHTGGVLYMERYYLKSFRLFGKKYAIFIQRFNRSDAERELHNHPWRWALSFILVGWYFEYRLRRQKDFVGTVRKQRRRFFNALFADTFHRVVLPVDERGKHYPVWTLFIHGPAESERWGFLHPLTTAGDYGVDGKHYKNVILYATFGPFEPTEFSITGLGWHLKQYRNEPIPNEKAV